MKMILVFVVIGSVVIFVILTTVYIQKRSEMIEGRYRAAENIINEDLLNYSIRNHAIHKDREPSKAKLMVCLKPMHTKEKDSYVFDPEKGIYIGRRRSDEKNMVYLNDIQVSKEHCVIYSYGERIYMKDMNSSNGSIVKRRFTRYSLAEGNVMELHDKDKLYIGSAVIKVFIFYYGIA